MASVIAAVHTAGPEGEERRDGRHGSHGRGGGAAPPRRAWSAATSGRWREDAPALGQCSVTALLLHDRYGAEILSTPTPWGPHFYNRTGGERLDLTAEQFAALGDGALPAYRDRPASRDEAMADTTPERYAALAAAFDAARD